MSPYEAVETRGEKVAHVKRPRQVDLQSAETVLGRGLVDQGSDMER